MIRHDAIDDDDLHRLIASGHIRYGGNSRLRVYGRLDCGSGKRMKRAVRVFFACEDEALAAGFRPCGNCMRNAYRLWKLGSGSQASGHDR